MSEVTYKKIVDVEQIDTLGEGTTLFVNDGGSMKQMGAAALGAVKSVNGVLPDENGDIEVNAAEKIVFAYMPEMGDLLCEKTATEIHELYNNVTTAHGLCFILRVYDFTNPMAPIPDYLYNKIEVESIQNGGTYYKLIYHIHFGDVVPPVLVDAINNTITLDPVWVKPEADPEPTGAHQMLVTGADGNVGWEERTHWADSSLDVVLPEVTIDKKIAYLNDYASYTRNLQQDHTYHVVCDGAEYQCSPVWNDILYSYTIGNASLASLGSDTGEPFFINAHNNTQMTIIYFNSEGQHTIAIDEGVIDTVHPLDPKYLPEDHINKMIDSNEKITALTEEMVGKAQGVGNAQKLLFVNDDGNVDKIAVTDGLAYKDSCGKNIFQCEWVPGIYQSGTGVFVPQSEGNRNVAFSEKVKVNPNTVYTLSMSGLLMGSVYSYLFYYDKNGSYIERVNYVWNPSQNLTYTFRTIGGAEYIAMYLYSDSELQNPGSSDEIKPKDFMIEKGETATSYEPYRATRELATDFHAVYDQMAEGGLVPQRFEVPGYYFANNYIDTKCAKIRELLDGCAGNGDVFIFVTDQHWEYNARNSPALMNYISKRVHIPRLFSGGDTSDNLQEEYANLMNAAYAGDMHYCAGNHDYSNGMDGNKLAYLWDMGKRWQIGNAKEHYYYVDNPQQSIRYVVLCAYSTDSGDMGSAYDVEQIDWLRDVALDVESGWTVIVVTHSLYYAFGTSQTPGLSPDGASDVQTVLDAATCDVACVVQGHAHLDRIVHTPGGIPVVLTTCDKYGPWMSGETNNEPWLSESRHVGTITEQAFDVVVLDKAARKLTFVRIGAPADNWTDGTSTGTVEERVVTY